MRQFKDSNGRQWTIHIDIGQIKAVRDLVKVDLYSLFKDEAQRVFSDPILMVDTLYVLCRKECETRKISDENFGAAFSGDVLESAANALLEAVVDFFPPSRQTILKATIKKSQDLAGQVQTEALAKIEALTLTDLRKPIASAAS